MPEVLAGLRTAESIYFDTISQIVIDRWSHGRVLLLGDAAWCVTLFAGYGSALAVGGADLLGTTLHDNPDDLQTALTRWEAELRPEVERKQWLGRRVKSVYAPANPIALWLNQLLLRVAALPPGTALLGPTLHRRLTL